MRHLQELLGRERGVDHVSRTLSQAVRRVGAPAVGALHVVCSDEAEHEGIDAFDRWFARDHLPELKFASRAPLRTRNLGARYEWGAIRIADRHFALPKSTDGFTLMVVKINTHVSASETGHRTAYGHMDRYGAESPFCGALRSLLDDERLPFADELREMFTLEGKDRLAMLRDPQQVSAEHCMLMAALSAARLQARRAVVEIQDSPPGTPMLYWVLPCVTLNRSGRDREVVCGIYTIDRRSPEPVDEYIGLGADPSQYALSFHHGRAHVTDEGVCTPRQARDHRRLVWEEWKQRPRELTRPDARVGELLALAQQERKERRAVLVKIAKELLLAVANVSPVPAAVALFADGIAGIHHLHRAHRLARRLSGPDEARHILHDLHERLDTLPPDTARQVIDLLVREQRG